MLSINLSIAAAISIVAICRVAVFFSGFLYPTYTIPTAIVTNKTTTKGCRKKIKGNRVPISSQKKRVLGIKMEASISGQDSCKEINNSETPEKFTRLINNIIIAAQTNKPSFLFLTTSQERSSDRRGTME
jgi:hypothetical protein